MFPCNKRCKVSLTGVSSALWANAAAAAAVASAAVAIADATARLLLLLPLSDPLSKHWQLATHGSNFIKIYCMLHAKKKKLLRSINVNSGCPHSVAYRCSRLCAYPCHCLLIHLLLPQLINSTPTSQAFCLLLLLLPLLRINKYISLTYAQINNRAIF